MGPCGLALAHNAAIEASRTAPPEESRLSKRKT